MRSLTVGSLFAGVGGFDLAARALGWDTRWFVEVDPFCRAVLAHHFPERPVYGAIESVDFTTVERVHVLCGGFPCQPASHAGKRRGTADHRWLWPEFARAIRVLRPDYAVLENVSGLASVNDGGALGEILGDVAALGYDAVWDHLSARECGAPHERNRLWLVAYPRECGRRADRATTSGEPHALERSAGMVDPEGGGWGAGEGLTVRRPRRGGDGLVHAEGNGCGVSGGLRRDESEERGGRSGESVEHTDDTGAARQRPDGGPLIPEPAEHGGRGGGVGDAEESGLSGRGEPRRDAAPFAGLGEGSGDVCGWADGIPVRGEDGTVRLIPAEAALAGPESPLWPVADGVPGRVARLRAIGNAVIPAWVLRGPFAIVQRLEEERDA